MSDLAELELTVKDSSDMASWNHSWTQVQLLKSLLAVPKYTPTLELTLDVSTANLSQFDIRAKEELKPDICLYPATRRGLSRPNDILRMLEMPLAAIEILSPKQGVYDIKEKFKAYFALGVKSCWLVTPELEVISVYTTISDFKNYDKRSGSLEVVDETLEIRLPLDQIFN